MLQVSSNHNPVLHSFWTLLTGSDDRLKQSANSQKCTCSDGPYPLCHNVVFFFCKFAKHSTFKLKCTQHATRNSCNVLQYKIRKVFAHRQLRLHVSEHTRNAWPQARTEKDMATGGSFSKPNYRKHRRCIGKLCQSTNASNIPQTFFLLPIKCSHPTLYCCKKKEEEQLLSMHCTSSLQINAARDVVLTVQ